MRSSSQILSSAAVLLAAAAIAAATAAQAPPAPPSSGSVQPPEGRIYPAPTNLKVLPKNLTGQQVHEVMEKWEAALGAHCNTCHVEDRSHIGPNGRPMLNFADDSKPMKNSARIMYSMVESINTDYVAMVDAAGIPVTCGTCHRGHLEPEAFVAPPKNSPLSLPGTLPAQP